jgi:predicted lysophospholipase L1 biosynthesis ABC-type transport system permease subunit
VTSAALAAPSRWLALRLALRELRGGVRGFAVFISCIALGVTAIAGVGSFAQSLVDGLAREGRSILGGDVAFTLIQREASPQERAFLAAQGTVSLAATLRAMARTADGRSSLVELKAVDAAYPLYGAVATPSGRSRTRRCWRGSICSRARASWWAMPRSSCARISRASPTSSPAASASDRACC